MEAVAAPSRLPRARRRIDGAASALFVAALAALLAVVLGLVGGYRPLIVRSDSMSPALRTGDLIVTKRVAAADVALGDVVTFSDPTRHGELVTHRIALRRVDGSRAVFVTRGDANTGVERWSIAADGSVGELSGRIPKIGYAIAWLTVPGIRLLLVPVAALILGAVALRAIWSS
jgi:signal peptidase